MTSPPAPTSTSTPSTRCSTARARSTALVERAAAVRSARARAHRPRRDERRGRALQGVRARPGSSRSSAARSTSSTTTRRRGARRAARAQPPDAAGRQRRRLPQPRQALLGRLPRGPAARQADRRHGADRAPRRGRDRAHRLPRLALLLSASPRTAPATAREHVDELIGVLRRARTSTSRSRRTASPPRSSCNEGIVRDRARDRAGRLVGTGDVHYLRREDYDHHTALLCVQTKSTLAAPKMTLRDERVLPQRQRARWRARSRSGRRRSPARSRSPSAARSSSSSASS